MPQSPLPTNPATTPTINYELFGRKARVGRQGRSEK
jgi:hypothetical protein